MTARRRAVVYATRESNGGRELLVFRQPHDPEAGTHVPAGGIETGESPVDAAVRELLEETGVTVGAALVRPLGRRVEMHPNGARCENWYFHVAVDVAVTVWQH